MKQLQELRIAAKIKSDFWFSCCCCNFTIGYLGYQRFVAAPQQEEATKCCSSTKFPKKQLME
jgi:hypothetical protein